MTNLELQHDLLKRIIHIDDAATLLKLWEYTNVSYHSQNASNQTIKQMFGSWNSDKTSDTIIQELYDARINQSHEVTL